VTYLALLGFLLTILTVSRDSGLGGASVAGAYDSILVLLAGSDVGSYPPDTHICLRRLEILRRVIPDNAHTPVAGGVGPARLHPLVRVGCDGSVWGVRPRGDLQIAIAMPIESIFALPIALQEMVMAIWLIVKGFDPSARQPGELGFPPHRFL